MSAEDEVRAVSSVIVQLAASVQGTRVHDRRLRERIVVAHRDSGMPDDAEVALVMRAPADAAQLAELNSLSRARFGVPIPAALETLLGAHDGIWVRGINEPRDDAELLEESYEAGVLSAAKIAGCLRSEVFQEARPDGSRLTHYPPVLPFFDVPDQGWHALDFKRRTSGGKVPVVAYYFDEVHGDETSQCQQIAGCFAEWFEGWVRGGFSPFWHEAQP